MCIQRNKATSDIIDEESGKTIVAKGEFAIKCDGIPADPMTHVVQITDPIIQQALGQRGMETYARTKDPVLWAEDNITVPDMETKIRGPWLPQGASGENVERYDLDPSSIYYQEMMVKCTARRQIYRIGRRSGKTWTLVMKMLHRMFTEEGYRILVITPNIAQLDIIFSIAMEFIKTSSTLDSPGNRFVKTPQRFLKLANGSFMRGFVSGNETIRGQSADMIVIDEGDYLTTSDLSAIVAILSEHKDTVMCVSSTPSGAREQFWKWDLNPKFRSFHYPSMCRPNWDEDMEIEQKRENLGVKYIHEILAEYGELNEGVFQHGHIDVAIDDGDYFYSDQVFTPGWIYAMGVDWNPVNGTECYVIGVDPSADFKQWKVVDKGQVFREGNTQYQAIQELIRLNRKWNPVAIYVDRGAGSMQIEYLNEFGRAAAPNTADKRLESIVEAIDFGSKIEIRHPTTGQTHKVYAKPAIVENAIRAFEEMNIQLSKYDADLERQLRGYVIDKIGMNGRPSYKMVSDDLPDHALDAFILALFAFAMKFTKMGNPEIIPIVRFTGHPGSDTISSVPESSRPRSRAIHKLAMSNKKEEMAEADKGYIPPSHIRTSGGAMPTKEAVDHVRGQIARRNGSKPGGRGPIRRSNLLRGRR